MCKQCQEPRGHSCEGVTGWSSGHMALAVDAPAHCPVLLPLGFSSTVQKQQLSGRVGGIVAVKCRAGGCRLAGSRGHCVCCCEFCPNLCRCPAVRASVYPPRPAHPQGTSGGSSAAMGDAYCLQKHGVGCRFGQSQAPPGWGQTVLGNLSQKVEGQACPAGFLLIFTARQPSVSWVWKVGRKEHFLCVLHCTGLPGKQRAMWHRSRRQEEGV